MIGWDANVLLRLLLRDDADQADRAAAEVARHGLEGVRIDRVALVEAVRVMRAAYRMDRAAIVALLDRILAAPAFVVDARGAVMDAVRRYERGRADFADYLIAAVNEAEGASVTHTFDRLAAEEPGFAPVA